MQKLGSLLADIRQGRSLTLRDVERATEISNAYLSQLENGKIKAPSPNILAKLASLYGVTYAMLMREAGYPSPDDREADGSGQATARLAARIGPVTPDEEDALVAYLGFMRSRPGPGRR